MAPFDVDLLVIGGGPAGSAAAIEACRSGLNVIVVDKVSFPRDKCCGDGLTTNALRQLESLGLDPALIPSWKVVSDVDIVSPSGRQVALPLPRHSAFAAVARRRELDDELLKLAAKAGASVRQNHEMIDIEPGAEGVTCTVLSGGEQSQLRAKHVIAADGMWSPTRKKLGLSLDGYRGDWHAFRQYFTGVSSAAQERLIVWFEEDLLPGYVWSFPLGDGAANVGFGIQRGTMPIQAMKPLWPDILDRPHIRKVLGENAKPEAPHRAWPIPARLGALEPTAQRVFFVGDALAATDPMTGEGIGQALDTGMAAVRAINNHRANRKSSPQGAEATDGYAQWLKQGMQPDYAMANRLSKILAMPRGVDLCLAAVDSTAWSRRNFARWLFEDYPRAALVTPKRWRRGLFSSPGASFDKLAPSGGSRT